MGNKFNKTFILKHINNNIPNFEIKCNNSIYNREKKTILKLFSNLKNINIDYRIKSIKYFFKHLKKFNLDDGILFLSVDLFDKSIVQIDNDIQNINLYLILIISLSYKYIDDNKILDISYIIKYVNYKYNKNDILLFEIKLLSFLDYKLSHPRLDSFIYYYLDKLKLYEIDMIKLIKKSKLILFDYKRHYYKNSLLAISLIIINMKNNIFDSINICYQYTDINLIYKSKNKFTDDINICTKFIINSNNKYKKYDKYL
jgi:hypothetical protein